MITLLVALAELSLTDNLHAYNAFALVVNFLENIHDFRDIFGSLYIHIRSIWIDVCMHRVDPCVLSPWCSVAK